jgi:hypothetical protein
LLALANGLLRSAPMSDTLFLSRGNWIVPWVLPTKVRQRKPTTFFHRRPNFEAGNSKVTLPPEQFERNVT